MSLSRPPKAILNPVNFLDQEPNTKSTGITRLYKAQYGWRRNGGHQTAGKFVS